MPQKKKIQKSRKKKIYLRLIAAKQQPLAHTHLRLLMIPSEQKKYHHNYYLLFKPPKIYMKDEELI